MLNLAAAVERAREFDIIHYEAAYYPDVAGLRAPLPDAPRPDAAPFAERRRGRAVVALSGSAVRRDLRTSRPTCCPASTSSAPCCTASTPTASRSARAPDDYLLFLGRFTEGKGVLQAIEVAKRAGIRLILAAADEAYYREKVAPLVDGTDIVYFGEADFDAKVKLYGGARALLYPIQAREPFGLVLAEAMACGTPVAALDRGAVREIVDDGVDRQDLREPGRHGGGTAARLRARSPARPRARGLAVCAQAAWSPSTRRSTSSSSAAAAPATMSRLERPDRARRLRASRRRVDRVRRDARPARRRGRHVVLMCASRGERGVGRAVALPDDGLAARRDRGSCARPPQPSASPRCCCSTIRTGTCAGRTSRSCTRRS